MRCEIPYPWIGPRATTFRMSMSSVPCSSSDLSLGNSPPRHSTYEDRLHIARGQADCQERTLAAIGTSQAEPLAVAARAAHQSALPRLPPRCLEACTCGSCE